MDAKRLRALALFLFIGNSFVAKAGVFEASLGFSFARQNYSNESFTWNRRWNGGLGYHITEISEIEFGYQQSSTRTYVKNYQDTNFQDEVYSLNWIQGVFPRQVLFQPYLKIGIGQLYRKATGTYWDGSAPPNRVDSLTVVGGAGLRIYLSRGFSIRAEALSYLEGGRISTYRNNVALMAGISIYF